MKINNTCLLQMKNHPGNCLRDEKRKVGACIGRGLGAVLVAAGFLSLCFEVITPLFLVIWFACAALVLRNFKREERRQMEELARGGSIDLRSGLKPVNDIAEQDDLDMQWDIVPPREGGNEGNLAIYV